MLKFFNALVDFVVAYRKHRAEQYLKHRYTEWC